MNIEYVELRIWEIYRNAPGQSLPETGELAELWSWFDDLLT